MTPVQKNQIKHWLTGLMISSRANCPSTSNDTLPSGFNKSVSIPSLVRETCSVCISLIHIRFKKKSDGQVSPGNEQPSPRHAYRHCSCRHQVGDAYVITRNSRRPPSSYLEPCVSRNEISTGIRKDMTDAARTYKSQNHPKEWNLNSSKIRVNVTSQF